MLMAMSEIYNTFMADISKIILKYLQGKEWIAGGKFKCMRDRL